LIEEPRAVIESESKADSEYTITIPKGKFEVDFLIKNIGKVDINYSFDKSELVDITPISGMIPVANETKIHLKILDHSDINIQSKDDINNNLKPKSAKIYFKSNAGDKELIIKY